MKFKKELKVIEKEHKAEVKSWRDDLGEEVKQKTKLEIRLQTLESKRDDSLPTSLVPLISPIIPQPQPSPILMSNHETICSICAKSILNFTPKYFLGEKVNAACTNCDDSFDYDDHTNPLTHRGFGNRFASLAVSTLPYLALVPNQQTY